MLVKAGVDVSKVRMVDDQTYDPFLLVHGSFDALAGVPVERTDHAARRPRRRSRCGRPPSSGSRAPSTSRSPTASSWPPTRSAAADFLRASFRAFNYCAAHAATCVGYLAAGPRPVLRRRSRRSRVEDREHPRPRPPRRRPRHRRADAGRVGTGGEGRGPVQAGAKARSTWPRARTPRWRLALPGHPAYLALGPERGGVTVLLAFAMVQ